MNEAPKWHIYIDTGGTFTDCLAHDPAGKLHRTKVLSKSALRGKIVRRLSYTQLHITSTWNTRENIFSGYSFFLLQQDHPPLRVQHIDPEAGILTLDSNPGNLLFTDAEFEISAGEEAPILAARIVTGTPLNQALPPLRMRLGSTKGTNALLEHKGARLALLITEGFTDLLAIGTQQRPDLFALDIKKARQLYRVVIPIRERISAHGEILTPLSEEEIQTALFAFEASGCETLAIALMHSYLNPIHEQQLAAAFRKKGIDVSLSSELAPSIKLLPRAQTSVVNAYLAPVIRNYRDAVNQSLSADSTLHIMTSAGGMVGESFFQPKDSLLSGPAGGVVGAAAVAKLSGIPNILTLDMGGTSSDVARYDGQYEYQFESRVGDAHLLSPSLAIETVAAGGGSICGFDGHKLTTGPESAGADPGPACYGAGGPLTLTDVNLLSGRIDPEGFGIPLNIGAAQHALAELSTSSGISKSDLLAGFLQIANEKMAEAIRSISIRRGYAPEAYALLSFGGAGGQHACAVAELLGITRILVPYDAGLLSAFGMGQAIVERFAARQVLSPLTGIQHQLPGLIDEISQTALRKLVAELSPTETGEVRAILLHMRFVGQDHTLEIPYSAGIDLSSAFRAQYEHTFGHWITDREIELESIKVIAGTPDPIRPHVLTTPTPYFPESDRILADKPVFQWEELQAGAYITGPALIVSKTSTTSLEAGWEFELDMHNHGLLSRRSSPEDRAVSLASSPEAAAIQLELFTQRFRAIAEEMGAILERTSFSVNVKERLDFSCALLDAEGELIVNAPHIPVHLGSMGVCVREVCKVLPLAEGDMAITNHPGYGGSHLPDITLISPIFVAGKLVAYVANRAHHAELGGKRPGSMPPDATRLIEEGVVIPPTYLIRAGNPQWESIRELFLSPPYPTRSIAENIADLNAGIASIRAGIQAMQILCAQHGTAAVCHHMEALKSYAHAALIKSLHNFPEGTFEAEESLDDGTLLKVAIHHHNQALRIDFTDSAGVHLGNLNANPAIVNSAVLYVLRLLLKENIPLNEGIMRAVKLVLPAGILRPHFPNDPSQCPAVVGGNIETSQRLVDTLIKAFGLAACSQGTMNNLLFGNDEFGYYETICGGVGAGPGFQGADAVHQHMTNTRITDPEILEFRYPVRLERFEIRSGSGGAGKWKGGNGVAREIRFLKRVSLTVLSQHRRVAPYGLAGGQAGQTGRQYIIRKDGSQQILAGIEGAQMEAGDRIVILTPGGGGYGPTIPELPGSAS